jgi:hypothetical protein
MEAERNELVPKYRANGMQKTAREKSRQEKAGEQSVGERLVERVKSIKYFDEEKTEKKQSMTRHVGFYRITLVALSYSITLFSIFVKKDFRNFSKHASCSLRPHA